MTEDLIKEVKHIQQCLINVDMEGEDWEEKMEAVHKLEDVATYLKDALGNVQVLLYVPFCVKDVTLLKAAPDRQDPAQPSGYHRFFPVLIASGSDG